MKEISIYSLIFALFIAGTRFVTDGIDDIFIIASAFAVISYFTRYKPFNFLQYAMPLALGLYLICMSWQENWGYLFVYVFGFSIMDIHNKLTQRWYIIFIITIALIVVTLSYIENKDALSSLRIIALNIFMVLIIRLRYQTKEREIKEEADKKYKDILVIKNLESRIKDSHIKELLELCKKDTHAWKTVINYIRQEQYTDYKRRVNDTR